ncbi:MAG TPA: tlde1 domain-containing protein [Pseudolabrys sp.]|nr:tlde1 domain-containing protein [Pseudolabrys sp.]
MLASAVAAFAISSLTPHRITRPAVSAVQPEAKLVQEPAPQVAGFDVGSAWAEEQAMLQTADRPAVDPSLAKAWEPAGGLATLTANLFPAIAPAATTQTAEVPLPPRAPSPAERLAAIKHVPVTHRTASAAPATADESDSQSASLTPQAPEPGYFDFFRKLFNGPDDAAKALLAANPKTAIYDIAHHVVYMPDGEKLEAHSGYGRWLDDPDSVNRKNLGVTPPNVYRVTFREKLFHGVRALRLTPVGDGKMYGRDGILAHSYMLGDDGQSNGCVSVKDYHRFLQAYEDGSFTQMIVVRDVDRSQAPSQVASAAPGNV